MANSIKIWKTVERRIGGPFKFWNSTPLWHNFNFVCGNRPFVQPSWSSLGVNTCGDIYDNQGLCSFQTLRTKFCLPASAYFVFLQLRSALKAEKKREKKKVWQKAGSNHWSIASKDDNTRFTICATGADVSIDSAVLFWFCTPWLTDVLSSQQWVIYSQTNGAVSNYTYLFRFVWFVIVFSDLLFCFLICHYVFWLVILFSDLSLCFLTCYNVFGIVVVFSELLFCFLDLHLRL